MNSPVMTTNYHTRAGVKKVQLIFACAWCPSEKYTALAKNQAYTHGICKGHKRELLKRYRNSEKSEDRRIRKPDGLTFRYSRKTEFSEYSEIRH